MSIVLDKSSGGFAGATGIARVLGKKWALLILENISAREAARFDDLKRALEGISSTVLSERLKELEHESLVVKKIYKRPPKIEYKLSDSARELQSIMDEIGRWQVRWKREKNLLKGGEGKMQLL
ncbi:winged helix-turn-helix transcriptional regulator [Candidatus Nitrososphaera evergladensis]|nr:helix-turn-helix domain-containing protein [Candidatus Nitrososphaera evergladensis]